MQNNYLTKRDAWGTIFMQPSLKIRVGAAEETSWQYKGYTSGYRN